MRSGVATGISGTLMPPALDRRAAAVLGRESPHRLALMLYGSVARGTSDELSDVDMLEVVYAHPKSYRQGDVNVTQYVPAHFHAMASQGSLFVLHLRQDGIVLSDDFGVMQTALEAYVPPLTYAHVWEQLAVVAGALDGSAENFEDHLIGLSRLGIYVLRTAAYLKSVESGRPEFDVGRLARSIGDDELGTALAMRRQSSHSLGDVLFMRRQIERFVPGARANPHRTVEAYAVENSTRTDLASLFAAVLIDGAGIDYSALTLPPF